METGKPQISILMAVYEPRMDWLREQLLSLDAQTYPNIKLYIRDDCSPTVSFDAIQSCVQDCIRTFPYELRRNEKNLGSNGTFELLTCEADGAYFAYCDQDDVWLPEKLIVLEERLTQEKAELVCSDVIVIDSAGTRTAESITQVRHRHVFPEDEKPFHCLLTRNFVIGCTMLVRRETAQEAVPFLNEMVHDHWIALVASNKGKLLSVRLPLIQYRIHGGNQTGVLVGVSGKKEYIQIRILSFESRLRKIRNRLPHAPYVDDVLCWAQARRNLSQGRVSAYSVLWKYRRENLPTTIFEMVSLPLPEWLFEKALKFAKRAG